MANTFTGNYNLIKSEIGGDNATWGDNLHTTLGLIDTGLVKGVESQIMSGITSTAIDLAAAGSNGTISTSSNLKYFENVQVGDKVRVSGSAVSGGATNGSASAPAIHTVIAKTSADSITVQTQLVDDSTSTITVAKVLEPVHINSGPIVCAPLTSLSAATRTAGGVGQPGTGSNADTTDALVANGDVNLAANVILGASGSNTIEPKGTIKADLIPETDNTYDLGSSTKKWADLHIDGTATVDSLVVTGSESGSYTLGGTGTITGCSSLTLTSSTISMSGYTIGSNAKNNRTVGTGDPSGGSDGDIHYKY